MRADRSSVSTSSIEPLVRRPLAERVAEGIARLIEVERLAPGSVLPSEQALATSFGVSRPIVREALKSLTGAGILEVHNGRGAVIRPLTNDLLLGFFRRAVILDDNHLAEIMELRRGIEMSTAMLAAERCTDEEAERLREIVTEMRTRLRDPDAYSQLDLAFHVALAEATHNAIVVHLIESMRDSLQDSIREGFRRRSKRLLERTQGVHEDIVAAVERGSAEDALAHMIEHFAIVFADLGIGRGRRHQPI